MTITACERDESGLLIVSVEIDGKYQLKMVLDTGATHTTLDANALYLLGYELKDSLGTVQIETANGIVETEVFGLRQLAALGLTKADFVVQVYDFLAHGIFSDYSGLLGLDFLEGTTFCVNTTENLISVS